MTNKTALITGASSGIGRELARLLAREGHDLVLVARNRAALKSLAEEVRRCGVAATVLPADLAQPGAVDSITSVLQAQRIEIDVLVNNAGFNVYGRFDHTDVAQELDMLQVNVVALTRLTKALLPRMIERRHGRILNVGSTGSFAPGPFDAVYCASKAYVLSFSEAIAEELRGTGVTVTTLCPGATGTAFATRAGMVDTAMFQGRVADPAVVAAAAYRALMAGRRVVIPGFVNLLMTQSIRFSPRAMVAAISRRMLTRVSGSTEAGVA